MKKRIIFTLLILGGLLVAAKNVKQVFLDISRAQSNLKTLQADFTQTKKSAFFAGEKTSRGTLIYEAPDKVLWTYAQPSPLIILVDGRRATIYHVKEKRAERIRMRRTTQRIQHFLLATEPLDRLKGYFAVTYREKKGKPWFELQLTPFYRRIKKILTSIDFRIDKKLNLPTAITIHEADGDETAYRFSHIVVNKTIPEKTFSLTLPGDVKVEEIHLKR